METIPTKRNKSIFCVFSGFSHIQCVCACACVPGVCCSCGVSSCASCGLGLAGEGTICGTCMGRTREEFIQGRTGAIIDASRQSSRIQGSTVYLDDSSARLDAHFNSRVGRARERGGETKTPSMSTRDQVRRPIVDNSSSAAKLES